jgi:Zn-finger nucleic acid-binding protein
MPRCPMCRSALVTITFGLYPIAICTSCSARWIQDGRQQRAINQVQEPSLMGQRPSLMAQGRSQPATQPALPRALTALGGQLLPGGSPW